MAQEIDELAAVSSNLTKAPNWLRQVTLRHENCPPIGLLPDSTSTDLKRPCLSFLEETTSIFFVSSCVILLLFKDRDMNPIPALYMTPLLFLGHYKV